MLPQSTMFSFRVGSGAAYFTALLLGLTSLALQPVAHARGFEADPAAVVTGDNYSVEVVGYNTAFPAQNIYLIAPNLVPTFGTTTGYANSALNGQTLTISSTEFTSGGITTDFISLSVPSNFVPAGTLDNGGHTLNAIQFSFGNYFGGTNPLDFTLNLSNYNVATSATFNFNGTTTSVPGGATSVLSNGGRSLSAFGQVSATPSTADISGNDVTALSFTVTYPAVPEPTTTGAMLLGTGLLLGQAVYRRRKVRG